VRVAATAGAGRRQACEQRMAIRDFGTHTLTSFFLLFLSSSLSDLVCKITYVCVCLCGRKGRSTLSSYLVEGMFVGVEVGIRQRRDPYLTSSVHGTSFIVEFI
jgi:hypothetical protein